MHLSGLQGHGLWSHWKGCPILWVSTHSLGWKCGICTLFLDDPNQVSPISSHFHVFSLSDLCCFGGGLPRPQSVTAHARTRVYMILLLCSSEIQSVWSVHSTVPHVSKFLELSQISAVTRAFSGWRDRQIRAEDRLATKRCDLEAQPVTSLLTATKPPMGIKHVW